MSDELVDANQQDLAFWRGLSIGAIIGAFAMGLIALGVAAELGVTIGL